MNINGRTIIFDFDGVIHSYVSGWEGAGIANDPPVEGIKEAIEALKENNYHVVVFSSRCRHEEGIKCIEDYLKKHDISADKITTEKVPAWLTIDDRCLCFDGDSASLLTKINNFSPWYEK